MIGSVVGHEDDRQGRAVIPKDVREHSGTLVPGELGGGGRGNSKITLQSSEISLKKAHRIGKKKLGTWTRVR